MKKAQTIIPGGLILLALGAWTGQARAQSVVGTWELAEVGGKALPAVVEEEKGCREEVVSATLIIAPDSTWRLESNERDVCPNKTDEARDTETGRYRLNGANLELLDRAGKSQKSEEGDDLDDISIGTLQGDTLTLKLGRTETAATFRRRGAQSGGQ